jgi:hypothetical protein
MITLRSIAPFALSAVAAAQAQDAATDVLSCSNVLRAGTLQLSTGTWTAPPVGALLATPGVAYSNSCLPAQGVDLVQALNTWRWIDDGRAPSSTSPAPAAGVFDRYRITEFEFGYCTRELDPSLGGAGATVRIRIFEDYDECTLLPAAAPVLDITVPNLPGSNTQGQLACVLMTLDLTGGFEFEMLADADGQFHNVPNSDRFGISLEMLNQTGTQLGAVGGFILAGNSPNTVGCNVGDETYYGNPGAPAGDGLDNGPGLQLDNAGPTTQCVQNIVGYPGLYLRLIADMDDCNLNEQPDIFDINSGASPDTNQNQIPDECEFVVITPYCTSSTTTNNCVPAINGTGNPSASAATGFTLSVSSAEALKQGLIFYGVDNTGFTPLPWSSTSTSFLCVKQPTQRTPVQNTGGTFQQCNGALSIDWNAYRNANPGALGAPFSIGDHVYAQAWFRDPPAPKTTNLSNAVEFILAP